MTNKYTLASSVTLKEVDGQTVLFSQKTGDFFGLNATASLLVQELIQSDFDSTAKTTAERYNVPVEAVRSDLTELVAELEQKKLLAQTPN